MIILIIQVKKLNDYINNRKFLIKNDSKLEIYEKFIKIHNIINELILIRNNSGHTSDKK